MLSGALPDGPDEVALGAVTARELGASIGDELDADGGPLRVTGLVALPAVGQLTADHPSLGQGAVLPLDELSRRNGAAYPVVVFVDLDHDSSEERARVTRVIAETMTDGLPVEAAQTYTDLRPGEINALSPATTTTTALAAVLGLAAVAALVVTLSSSVARQRRTFATLRALGFDSGQVRASVRWQTNVSMAIAVMVGAPIGVVIGRAAWRTFAEDLGSAATPVVPVAFIVLAAAALLVVANAVGEGPARQAAHTSVQSLRDA